MGFMNSGIFRKIFRRGWIFTLLAFWVMVGLNGCNPNNFKAKAAQVSQLVITNGSNPKTFNYALSQESPNIFGFTYETLATVNGVTKKIEPALAESWELSEDKLHYVFTLRENLRWSDGAPLTVDDVVFSFNDIYMNKAIPNYYQDNLRIGLSKAFPQVRKLDSRRVEFILPEPFVPFLGLVAASTAVLPEHALRQAVETKRSDGRPVFLSTWGTDADPKKIIVNGPYTIDSYATSERLVFRRNPYYWRKDARGNPQPYIERVIWQIVESTDNTALLQFRSGGLDILEIGPGTFQLLKREEKRGNFTIKNAGPSSGASFIAFNLNKGRRNGKPLVDPVKSRWFNNVAFRQAVAYAINRQAIIDNDLRGLGETQNSPVFVPSPYYLSPKEGLKVYDYNPEKAKEILLKAGFKYDNKGRLLDADGNQVRFTMLAPASNRPSVPPKIKQNLGAIGITLDLQYVGFDVIGGKISNTLDWESYIGAVVGNIDPHDGYNVWAVEGSFHLFNQKPAKGQPPIEGWEYAEWEKKIEDLFIEGSREFDETKRKAIYAETQRLAQEYLPFIHLVNSFDLVAVRNTIEGIQYTSIFPSPTGYIWNIYELKNTKDKA
ncbi:ABC transporter substrate-binding protein [Aetokthonos hydrillicola Thurmond2011]|jgi:peptide/nickel transport system substrate-binding protein|uniref:ABC transporter substrate-binding protein n=2 Tax=Aetokthonos TaxID=1550243 RepID=A0AAP5I3U0_9CYAN|nr:ABC transporter substrate-binding protein [Aetokthonos hydrillicola]MBO3460870.1 ABC transporter substrate-binding protein [Aetokthonos hydrillicola CCALA 1050]MBW4585663.1 ABC transporter substrate-binding protein [Aetokthonos hydrillicola CCALA 1050]MDR9894563.1 ABC transporter substrate-binding protein [Aetokthonos hydrillicola Thurmond2011]